MVKIESSLNDIKIFFVPDTKSMEQELDQLIGKIKIEKQKPFTNVFLFFPFQFESHLLPKIKKFLEIKTISKDKYNLAIEF
jgi:hypothetical protein